jgi:hypothetical protein
MQLDADYFILLVKTLYMFRVSATGKASSNLAVFGVR